MAVDGESAMGTTDTVVPITAAPSYAPEPVLVDAIELARAAAVEEAGADLVGEHAGVLMEAETVATHLFTCLSPGYRGWNWAVTIARAPGFDPTVSDVVLLPGDDALVAPPWVPWSERVQAGDLGVGDLLITPAEDPRLVPGLTGEDDLEGLASLTPLGMGSWELGLGRERVLSALGRDDAADRWMETVGPNSPMAKSAPLTCTTCGFLMTIGGPLGQVFGVCANLMSPADGHVVAMTYGCGAHSEVRIDPTAAQLGDVITVDEDAVLAIPLDAIPDPAPIAEVIEVDADAAGVVLVDDLRVEDASVDEVPIAVAADAVDEVVTEAIEEPSELMHEHLDLALEAAEAQEADQSADASSED